MVRFFLAAFSMQISDASTSRVSCTDRLPFVKPVAVSRKVKSALSQLASTVRIASRAGSCTTRFKSARVVASESPRTWSALAFGGRMLSGLAKVHQRSCGSLGRGGGYRSESPAQEQEVEYAKRK